MSPGYHCTTTRSNIHGFNSKYFCIVNKKCFVVVSVKKSGRVKQLYTLLTELGGSYAGFSISSSETKIMKRQREDFLCNFSHFRNYMRKFYHRIFFIILILRALDLSCFRHGVLLLLLITPDQNRGKPNYPRFQGNISQEPLKLFYQTFF